MNNHPYSRTRLKDYALWYYFRYYPSNNRLLQKLKEKGTEEDSEEIFKELLNLFQEDEIIKAKIDNYVFRNKNYRYIRQKMREKLFPSEKTEVYLEKYLLTGESILDESFLRKKIENYMQKGKSRYYIFQTLGETKADKEKLDIILEEYFSEGESEAISKEYEKLISRNPKFLNSREGKQKIIQKLLAKGFKYDEVKRRVYD